MSLPRHRPRTTTGNSARSYAGRTRELAGTRTNRRDAFDSIPYNPRPLAPDTARDHPGRMKPSIRWKKKAFVLLATTAVTLVLAEVVMRLFFPVEYRRPITRVPGHVWSELLHRRSDVPGLGYELRPGAEGDAKDSHIVVNHLGMRCHEPASPKPASLLRIAAIGDSVAFAFGIEEEQGYCSVLEELLNAPGAGRKHAYEVLNFAVTGYSSRDEAIVLEKKALPLAPDLVIVGYYLNDPDIGPVNALRMYFHETEWWEHFELLRLLAQKKRQWDTQRLGGGDYYRWLHNTSTEEWQSVLRAFEDMRRVTQANKLKVLFAVFPTFKGFETWDEYPYAELHEQVLAEARKAGFMTLDLYAVYKASGHSPAELRKDPDHPGPLGHAVAAQAMLDLIHENHAALFGVDE